MDPLSLSTARPTSVDPTVSAAAEDARARETAEAFEAAFLAEMFKNSGINDMPDAFGGGAGEDAFSGLLTEEYGRLLAESGGIGLAEQVFDIIKQRSSLP